RRRCVISSHNRNSQLQSSGIERGQDAVHVYVPVRDESRIIHRQRDPRWVTRESLHQWLLISSHIVCSTPRHATDCVRRRHYRQAVSVEVAIIKIHTSSGNIVLEP